MLKPKVASTKKRSRRNLKIPLLVLVLIGFVIFGIWFWQHQIKQNEIASQKAQITQAQNDIGGVVHKLEVIRMPDLITQNQKCERTSGFGDFSKGDLVCETSTNLTLMVDSYDDALSISSQLANNTYFASGGFKNIELDSSAEHEQSPLASQLDSITFNTPNNLNCSAGYVYYPDQSHVASAIKKLPDNGQSLNIMISCDVRPAVANLFN